MDWYYRDCSGKRFGLVSDDAVKALIAAKVVTVATPVWREGMHDWDEAGRTELASLFGVVTLPAPPEDPSPPAASPINGATHTVIFLQEGKELASIGLSDEPLVIGTSDECNVALDEPSVSGRHARLLLVGGNVCVEDLGSTNGTSINGQAVDDVLPLKSGDFLRMGDWEIEVRVEQPKLQPTPLLTVTPMKQLTHSPPSGLRRLAHLAGAFARKKVIVRSAIIVGIAVVLVIICTSVDAYRLGRDRLRGKAFVSAQDYVRRHGGIQGAFAGLAAEAYKSDEDWGDVEEPVPFGTGGFFTPQLPPGQPADPDFHRRWLILHPIDPGRQRLKYNEPDNPYNAVTTYAKNAWRGVREWWMVDSWLRFLYSERAVAKIHRRERRADMHAREALAEKGVEPFATNQRKSSEGRTTSSDGNDGQSAVSYMKETPASTKVQSAPGGPRGYYPEPRRKFTDYLRDYK